MNLQITPLTPLWTGNAERRGDQVLETGLLGSLRWWYEVLIRGLGYYACDPGIRSCEYTEKEKSSGICAVCQLFGCTGYARRFRLRIEGGTDAGPLAEVKLLNPANDNHRGWRVPTLLSSPFTISFLPTRRADLEDVYALALRCTLRLIERYGALGGKTSHGQGAVQIQWAKDQLASKNLADLREALVRRPCCHGENLLGAPDLRDLVGATILLDGQKLKATDIWQAVRLVAAKGQNAWAPPPNSTWVPSSPAVRASLRQWLRESSNFPKLSGNLVHERHRLMGTTGTWNDPQPQENRDRPKGSEIFVSHFYKVEERWTMRIFAFVPRTGNQVENGVRSLLLDPPRLKEVLGKAIALPLNVIPYPTDIELKF